MARSCWISRDVVSSANALLIEAVWHASTTAPIHRTVAFCGQRILMNRGLHEAK